MTDALVPRGITMGIGLMCHGCGAFFQLQPGIGAERDPGARHGTPLRDQGLEAGWMCHRQSPQTCTNCEHFTRIFLPMSFLMAWAPQGSPSPQPPVKPKKLRAAKKPQKVPRR